MSCLKFVLPCLILACARGMYAEINYDIPNLNERHSADAREWLSRFTHQPPMVSFEGEAQVDALGLPEFTVTPAASGRQMVRASLPFPAGSLRSGQGLRAHHGKQAIEADTRVLTCHPGTPKYIRRALVTFPYEFKDKEPVSFTLTGDGNRPISKIESIRAGFFEGEVGAVKVKLEPTKVTWTVGEEGPYIAEVRGNLPEWPVIPVVEAIENSEHYLWVRMLMPDETWPGVIEVKADALGTVTARYQMQRRRDGDGYAPDFGWNIRFDAGARLHSEGKVAEDSQHEFAGGVGVEAHSASHRLSFPTAHLKQRGHVKVEAEGDGSRVIYMRCLANEAVPHQEGAWRTAEFAFSPLKAAPVNVFLEPAHRVKVPPKYYDAIYGSGLELDLSEWPELENLREFHRDAIVKGTSTGDAYGLYSGYPPSNFSMNRLNYAVPMFEDYYLSSNPGIREAALAWCINNYGIGIYWSLWNLEGEIGIGFIGKRYFGGTRYHSMNGRTGRTDAEFSWRSNSAVDFSTKGFDAFFHAWEETGDPRMAVALKWQCEFARKNIHANGRDTRNIGIVRDWMNLYRFTGRQEYLDEALRLFRELRPKLFENNLFDQRGQPESKHIGYIDNDNDGRAYGFAKVYILGYALIGLPKLYEVAPDEPRLGNVITAVARYIAEVQDPIGSWRYPHARSSRAILSYGMDHMHQLAEAAKLMEKEGQHIDVLLDAIERGLQMHVQMLEKTGSIPGNLMGWEHSTGYLKEGQELHDLYKTPEERDSSRDYTEGDILFGALSSESVTHLTPVLKFYMKHRPVENLFKTPEPLRTVLSRAARKGNR